MKIKVSNVNTPNWKEVTVKSRVPAELEKLSELARNIWWAWNYEATELFRDLDPTLWKEAGQNPVLLLERMSYPKYVIRMAGETAKPGWIANVNPFVVVCCVSFVTRWMAKRSA
ncbi:DUF3417 domain-containing protein, partial [Bacteroides fragilis]|uniref:DUF3417 domain-containing protein n=1 Tax=Bacteroides fragilis TaxID=817 RepID=UPI0005CE65E3